MSRPWYEHRGGLNFRCTLCGKCCKTAGYVAVQAEEADAIAARYRPGANAFDLAGELWNWELAFNAWLIEVDEGESCPLLGEDGCTVHDIKPRQCATYPFWTEVIESPTAWAMESLRCEGIDEEGDLYSPDLIDIIASDKRLTNENL